MSIEKYMSEKSKSWISIRFDLPEYESDLIEERWFIAAAETLRKSIFGGQNFENFENSRKYLEVV